MTVGSVGSNSNQPDYVENVLFENITAIHSSNAAWIKTYPGRGYVRNVTFRNVHFEDVNQPIYVTSCICTSFHLAPAPTYMPHPLPQAPRLTPRPSRLVPKLRLLAPGHQRRALGERDGHEPVQRGGGDPLQLGGAVRRVPLLGHRHQAQERRDRQGAVLEYQEPGQLGVAVYRVVSGVAAAAVEGECVRFAGGSSEFESERERRVNLVGEAIVT